MDSDRPIPHGLLAALPGLPLDADGPVFTDPWQVREFACRQFSRAGPSHLAAVVDALSFELSATGDARKYDPADYFRRWLVAIEQLVTAKELISSKERDLCAWTVFRFKSDS
jgi:hypothetical protein